MPIPKVLLLSSVLILFFNGRPSNYVKDCDNLIVEVESSLIKGSKDLFTATIKASGGKSPYYYVLLDKDNNLLSLDYSQKEFKNVKSDKYLCIVIDSQNCKKEFYTEIK